MAGIVRFTDCPPVPWKNGAGTTRELWARRDAAGDALIRISVAEIRGKQGFSTFPGIDRVILQLDGPAMVLTIDGTPHRLQPLTPLAFAGEADVVCDADDTEPAHDLNLMCRRGSYVPAMERIATLPGQSQNVGSTVTAFLALIPCALVLPLAVKLQPLDLIVADGPVTLRTEGAGGFIRLSAKGGAP
ncbi:MAG: HutD family protein [Proteobacteria bacterium]|nr:HutD family protein [Pseudomonadota bacterium]